MKFTSRGALKIRFWSHTRTVSIVTTEDKLSRVVHLMPAVLVVQKWFQISWIDVFWPWSLFYTDQLKTKENYEDLIGRKCISKRSESLPVAELQLWGRRSSLECPEGWYWNKESMQDGKTPFAGEDMSLWRLQGNYTKWVMFRIHQLPTLLCRYLRNSPHPLDALPHSTLFIKKATLPQTTILPRPIKKWTGNIEIYSGWMDGVVWWNCSAALKAR